MKNHRSFGMWLICQILPHYAFKGTQSREDAQNLLASLPEDRPVGEEIFKDCKTKVSRTTSHGIELITIGEEYEDILFYLHGGAFVFQLDKSQVDFCDRFAAYHRVRILVPVYPLIPQHTCREVIDITKQIYNDLPAGTPIMGDSSGANLAINLTPLVNVKPRLLILLSPWVDLSLRNVKKEKDQMHGRSALQTFGEVWAGDLNPADPRISPLYADLAGFPKCIIYSGTAGMLYPDALAFHERLLAAGVDSTFTSGHKMPHDFMLIPTPERDEVIREIKLK